MGGTGLEPVTPSVSCWGASQLRQPPGRYEYSWCTRADKSEKSSGGGLESCVSGNGECKPQDDSQKRQSDAQDHAQAEIADDRRLDAKHFQDESRAPFEDQHQREPSAGKVRQSEITQHNSGN